MYTTQILQGFDLLLDEAELWLRRCDIYGRYAASVFNVIRAKELGGYYPAKKMRESAYAQLREALVADDIAEHVMAFYTEAERQCRLFDDAIMDAEFLKAAEALSGLSVAPLIAELDTQTAFILWSRAGSWTGVLRLLGLEPMTEGRRKNAIRKYAIANASLDLLPEEYAKKLNKECAGVLRGVIDRTKKTGEWPLETALQPHYKQFRKRNLNVSECLRTIGISVTRAKRGKPNPDAPIKLRNGQLMWPAHMRSKSKKDEYWRKRGCKKTGK